MVSAGLRQAFLQPDQQAARGVWRRMADQFRPRWPKLAALMDEGLTDRQIYERLRKEHGGDLVRPHLLP